MSSAQPPLPPVPKMNEPALPPPPGAAEETQEPRHGGFFSDPRVASLTGVGTSVLIHSVIIIFAFAFAVTPVREALLNAITTQEQNVIPTAELATDTPGGIPNPGMNNDATRAAAQMMDSSVTQSDAFSQTKSEALTEVMSNAAPSDTGAVIGQSMNTGGMPSSGGGKLASFGPPGGGQGIGPKGAVFGNGGNAYKIMFVCDGTGTMIGLKQQLLVRELNSTISKLKPVQEFNVIFFFEASQAGPYHEAVDKNKLLPATPPNIKKTADFLNKFSFKGSTNPIPAIEAAFKQKPQLMYILSDGEFDNLVSYDDVIKKVDELNPDKKVKINTIMFGDRDPRAEQALKKIAEGSGGRMIYVALDSLLKQ